MHFTPSKIQAGEVSMSVYNSEWYAYPLELQKVAPLIIQQARNPVIINGFKLFSCTLENYTRVIFVFFFI